MKQDAFNSEAKVPEVSRLVGTQTHFASQVNASSFKDI